MGTTIKIEANRGEKTTKKQWNRMVEIFYEKFYAEYDDEYCVYTEPFRSSYSCAGIEEQLGEELLKEMKGSDISIYLWIEEREPDECLEL